MNRSIRIPLYLSHIAVLVETPILGILEWFKPGEREKLDRTISLLDRLGIEHIRSGLSWCDWRDPYGREWIHEVYGRIGRLDVLPCLAYTPHELGIRPHTWSPPRNPSEYSRFVESVLDELPFERVELWNEHPGGDWDRELDPDGEMFSRMVREAAHACSLRNVQTVLGGMDRLDLKWWDSIARRGALDYIDVIGFHSVDNMTTREQLHPGWKFPKHPAWDKTVRTLQDIAQEATGERKQVWLTEVGYSTPDAPDYAGQVRHFLLAMQAPVERVYWYALEDMPPEERTIRELQSGSRCEYHYHLGMIASDGRAKPLYSILEAKNL